MSGGAPLVLVDKATGRVLARYATAAEASLATGHSAHRIRRCARSGGSTQDGFYWRREGDESPIAYMRCVVCTEVASGEQTVFPSAREAAAWLGCSYAAVRQALDRRGRLAGAFELRYA